VNYLERKVVSLLVATLLVSFVLTFSAPVFAKPGRGYLYYEDELVRTFVPNGKSLNGTGTDPLYSIPNQTNVIQYAPGDKEWTGGHWQVWAVTWNVDPYLITNYDDLYASEQDGNVTFTRMPDADVLCPVQPGSMWKGNSNTPPPSP
jgi:hypothetical protein